MVLNITSIIIASIRFDARAEGSLRGGAGERRPCVRWRTELAGAWAYRPVWPAPGLLDVHDKVREANTAFLNLVELSMNGKAVVSAILAMYLATGGLAFADDHGDRNDQGRNEKAQRGGQQDHRASNNNARRDEHGAGPNHDFRRGQRLPTEYRGRQYVVDDWRGHHLSAPPRGYHWVQTGGDYVLVAIATGVILQLLLNH